MDPAAQRFSSRLGYEFSDDDLLERALAHRSWCAEHAAPGSNERLEFLGDAVLSLVIAEHLHREHPDAPEGQMAKLRAFVVSEPVLAERARELDLGDALLLGRGEDASGGRDKPSLLSDALEAVIGAIYLDGGFPAARATVLDLLGDVVARNLDAPDGADHKTRLQELAARRGLALPGYQAHHDGPDHDRVYHVTVEIGGAEHGRGSGRTKKAAEQAAAAEAYCRLQGAAD